MFYIIKEANRMVSYKVFHVFTFPEASKLSIL